MIPTGWTHWQGFRNPLQHMLVAVGLSVPVSLALNEVISRVLEYGPEEMVQSRWIAFGVTVVVAGSVSYLVAVLLRRAELRVERLNRELERANVEKDELMGLVSHDLKNPLSAVLSAAEMLAAELQDPDQNELCRIVLFKAQRMWELVGGVLELGRIDAGLLAPPTEPTGLCLIAERAKESFAYQAQLKGVEIQCREPGREFWVNAGPEPLRLVIDNLLGNAIKYSPVSGRVTLEVRAGEPGEVWFVCHDQGPGLEPELAGRIFGKFEQGPEAQGKSHLAGGLGLYIAKRLTEGLGGRIWVESVPGMGASFFLALPILTPDRSA